MEPAGAHARATGDPRPPARCPPAHGTPAARAPRQTCPRTRARARCASAAPPPSQVNALLRRACFKPLASVAGPAAAALLTFGVSALFHEYQFALTFQGGGYRLGRVSAFFGAMASLCLAQTACERVPALRALARALPEPVQIGLNICTLAPFGHWFVLIWVEHGFMDTIARMVPTLSCA